MPLTYTKKKAKAYCAHTLQSYKIRIKYKQTHPSPPNKYTSTAREYKMIKIEINTRTFCIMALQATC